MISETMLRWLDLSNRLDFQVVLVLSALFIVAAFVPVPRTFLVVGAGATFGLQALFVIVPSTTLGSILAFSLARHLMRNVIAKQIGKRPSWRVVAQAVDDEGWRIVALMRLWGPLPNFVQNYMFGLTTIGLVPFSIITAVFTFPQIVFYTYLGASGRQVLLNDGAWGINALLLALATTIMVVVVILVSRRVRAILSRTAISPSVE